MKRKLLGVMLSAAMVVTMLAGCGASKPTETKPEAAPAETTADTVADAVEETAAAAGDESIHVFYYTYSDTYISSVRTALDAAFDAAGLKYQDYDSNSSQTTQSEQVNTAITNGATCLVVNIVETGSDDAAKGIIDAASAADIPVIFFNREVSNDIVNSYDKCVFVGTDAAEAGHMQGTMIAEYLLANYDTADLNGDGVISYVMFKGQEGNNEAIYRTQYSVEDANKLLVDGGKKELSFYDAGNKDLYLVDKAGTWSATASNEYMTTILSEYSEANGNMVEMVICNNDGMAEGAITALQTAGYNKADGTGTVIPVFGVDATDAAKSLIGQGVMTGTIKQDAEGMASAIALLAGNTAAGKELMDATDSYNIDADAAKIRIAYGIYTGE